LHPLDTPGADAFVLMEGFADTGDVKRTGEQARFVQRFLEGRIGTGQIDGVEADFLGKRDLLFDWEFGNVAWNAHSDVHGLSLLTWALARSPLPTLSIRYRFREDLRRFYQLPRGMPSAGLHVRQAHGRAAGGDHQHAPARADHLVVDIDAHDG